MFMAAVWLVGCGGVAPRTQIYSLPSVTAPKALSRPPLPGVLIVLRFTADSVLGSRHIAWRSSPEALTIGNYAGRQWSIAPPEQMQVQLERCLTDANIAEIVAPASARVQADWVLSGRLRYFEQQLTGPKGSPNNAQARVAAELVLMARSRGKLVWRDTIDAIAPLRDADPTLIAEGVQQALEQFCTSLTRRLAVANIVRP